MVFILISNKKKDWNEFVFKTLENLIEYNNSHKNLCNIMLTGGDTANNLYRNWKNNFSKIKKNLNIFFTDERCISKESHLSNYYNLVSNLYIKIPSHHKILPIYNEDLSINENIKNYELLLPNFIDITVITLGSGGHIASIFSKSDSNLKNKNLIYVNAPIKPHKRLSISISYINKSKKILLLVKGIEKAKILNSFAENQLKNNFTMPISFLNRATILIDEIGYRYLTSQSLSFFNQNFQKKSTTS